MTAPRPAASDLSFFSKTKTGRASASTSTAPAVTTRFVTVQRTVKATPDPKLSASKLPVQARDSPIPSTFTEEKSNKRGSPEPTVSTNKKKRRTSSPPVQRDEQSSAEASASSSSQVLRTAPATRARSLAQSPAPTALSSGSRSRSISVFPVVPPAPRHCGTDEDGRVGPGVVSSECVVRNLMKTYKAYFRNPDDPADKSFEPHPTDYPVTELEYPNTGASERFILLVPKDKDHYNPIMCLENTLHTIIEYYLTPAQRALFGTLPSNNLVDDDCPVPPPLIPHISTSEFIEASSPPSVISSASSPASSLLSESSSASSVSSATSFSSLSSLSSVSSLSSLASLSSLSALASHASQPSPSHPPSVNYLRLFQRAINKQDGPLFLKVMDAINALLRLLKYPPLPLDPFSPAPPNNLCAAVATWPRIPEKVLTRIVDETYQRAVGPHVAELKRYSAFSSEVYGELMPSFVAQIVATTGLGPDSLFVDLGSGVGNVILQASLQTGCQSFGVEIMPDPAKIARSQLEQCKMRCRMWGVSMGEVELEEGDMLKSKRVDELVPKADVVLVNNKVFLESLNEAIRPKFLDLKEGAVVVSLKPFVSSQRLTGRNLDDISAIFQVTERPYYPGSVSWGNGSGSYFLHRVDREGYADRKAEFESSRNGSSRGTRSRR